MVAPAITPKTYTAAEVASLIGVRKVDVVYAHIHAGHLVAFDVGTGGTRPCWRITQAALDAFIQARASRPMVGMTGPKRSKRRSVTRYF